MKMNWEFGLQSCAQGVVVFCMRSDKCVDLPARGSERSNKTLGGFTRVRELRMRLVVLNFRRCGEGVWGKFDSRLIVQ